MTNESLTLILLDTNVVSEIFKATADENVILWIASCKPSELATSVITITELRFGAICHPDKTKGATLHGQISEFLQSLNVDNLLTFDLAATEICAKLMAESRAFTPREKLADLQIAAIAMSRNIPIATRNIRDFRHKGLEIVNPWATP